MQFVLLASEFGLYKNHLADNYIWLVDENGKDRVFTGIFGDANEGLREPYLVCTEHTKEDWEAYQKNHSGIQTKPTEPENDEE